MDESLAPFYRNRRRLPRKQRRHECSSKANRQQVKRNPPSSSDGIDLRISSPNTFTRYGSKLINKYMYSLHEIKWILMETSARSTSVRFLIGFIEDPDCSVILICTVKPSTLALWRCYEVAA
ncbi:unnamed protein product [Protopolystoma xenopodis]|uniref:Uncharacterized protein n=1 Tax=Protopolystoma xenopodis TaxID=117903 RepID=A0A3S5CLA7_9PLAT|nr:unnamed protein product [Protopolystoma xenopodis]